MDYRYNFDDGRKSKRKRNIFVFIFIILVIIISSFIFKNSSNVVFKTVSNIVVAPFEFTYNFTKNTFSPISTYFKNKTKLSLENENLQSENENLKMQLLESQKILDENNSLKEMLEIKKAYQHFEIKLSKVIYREHDNWTQTFRIDLGEDDGIKLNQAVVHKDGLVGYITKVDKSTSTVTTILDPVSSVSVNISTINEPAVLQGDLTLKSQNKLKLNYIPIDTEVSIADMLYTSGLGSIYPSSIPVGKITEVIGNKNDINRYAIVEPSVNIRTISEVGVIINY
jgi:rod shape-determining protein MreC